VGGFDYEDLATQTTPLNYTTGFLQLTNDILGANTKTNLNPYGVTSVWNDTTDTFDFNQLSIGDEVFLRVHLNLTTTTSNQISGLRLLFAEGTPSQYILPIDLQIYHKTAGLHDLMREISFYIGNEDWRTLPVKLQFNSDANASIKVHGFHPYIIRKSVNILDVNDDNYKTFEIANIEVNLDDTTVADGRISFGYNLATSKINAVLFDAPYSSYIYNYDQLKLIYDFSLNFFDKTNGKSYSSFITGFTQIGARYRLDLDETLNYTDYAILDKIEVFINATKIGGSSIINHSDLTLDDGTNPHGTTKNDVGLGNVDNTSDVNKPISTATQTALNLKEDKANKGIANGYVPLNASTLIDSIYLPSYVDDVIEVANFGALPVTGETGKIYVTLDDNKQYRWSGSVYVNMTEATIPSLQQVTDIDGTTTNQIQADTSALVGVDAIVGINLNVGGGNGLSGYSQVGYGVYGDAVDGDGLGGESTNGNAISGLSLNGNGGRFETINGSKIATFFTNNVEKAFIDSDGDITANSFIKTGGTASQFLKADGSVDTNAYLTGLSGWGLQGNGGTNPATDFIGTTDNQNFIVRTNSIPNLELKPDGTTLLYAPAIQGGNPSFTNVGFNTFNANNNYRWTVLTNGTINVTSRYGGTLTTDIQGGGTNPFGGASDAGGYYAIRTTPSLLTRFVVANNGNVGIGSNTTPTDLLHVQGNVRITGAIKDSLNSAGTSGQILSSTVTGTAWINAPVGNVGTVTSVALANGTTGTDINISGSPITTNGTITLNIPTASATNRGALSSTDWSAFNNKIGLDVNGGIGLPIIPISTPISNTIRNDAYNIIYTDVFGVEYKLSNGQPVDKEIPTGLINGTNTTFTLANTPIVGSEHIYRNGILQEEGAGNDYTISGATITYLTAPLTGDKLRVTYRR